MQNWDAHKRIVLSKSDKSFKASIDEPIVKLVDLINTSKDFFTTSSCSGRIMLIREGDLIKRKNGASFTFVSHELVSAEKYSGMFEMCKSVRGNIFLKLEPLILHIESRTLELGIKLLHRLKRESEFKHTCIVSAANEKVIVCVKAMVKMEVPVVYGSELIVNLPLLEQYLDIANVRMKENFSAIEKLEALITDGILSQLSGGSQIPRIGCQVPILSPASYHDNLAGTPISLSPSGYPFMNYTLSLNLKTVTDAMGQSFGTIPSTIDNSRPKPSLNMTLNAVGASMLVVVSQGELWSLVHFRKRNRSSLKFQWHKLLENVVSLAVGEPNLIQTVDMDGIRNIYRIDMK